MFSLPFFCFYLQLGAGLHRGRLIRGDLGLTASFMVLCRLLAVSGCLWWISLHVSDLNLANRLVALVAVGVSG